MDIFKYITEKNEGDIDKALSFISMFIMSGGKYDVAKLSSKSLEFLKKSVLDGQYKLYRGMYFMRFRVDRDLFDDYNKLKQGDFFPIYLQSKNIKPYTKKLSVAKHYAKEGHINIITETIVDKKNIVADLENLILVLKDMDQHYLDTDNFKYFKKDKEVLVKQPVMKSKIIYIKGKL